MTTRINVTVGDGGLLDRNAQQQAANRQGYVVRNEQNKAAAQGETELQQRRRAEGRDPATGLILPSRGSRLRRVDQQPAAFRSLLVQADYYVVAYSFTTGEDLDTRTQLVYPGNTISNAVGFCKDETISIDDVPVVIWGGDNVGTGVESVLIDRVAYTEQTNSKTIRLKLSAFWYDIPGDSVTIKVTGYKGGEMVQQDYAWVNPSATKTWEDFSTFLSYAVTTNISACVDGDFVTYLTIDYLRGNIVYSQSL